MRTEIRKVTIEQEVYIADDGRVFEDEDECSDYEFDLVKNTIDCRNSKFEKTDDIESCPFVNLVTDENVKNFKFVCEVIGISSDGVDKPGVYMYSDYIDRWVDLDEVISKIRGGSN